MAHPLLEVGPYFLLREAVASLGRPHEEGAMSGKSGGAESNPRMFMMRNAGEALIPKEFSFSQRDESFNGKTQTNIARIGLGEMNIFSTRLKAGDDADFFKATHAPTSEEAAIPENLFWQSSEGGFEPAKSGSDKSCVGDIVLEGVDNMGHPFDDGHQYLGAELRSQWKLSSHNRADVIFVKRNNPIWN